MNRRISRCCLISALLGILLSCLTLVSACGGGGGGGGGSENATITGTVSGTRVSVFDRNDNQVASTVASGSPKTFSVSLPAGTYRIYIIENEGTDNQRVFPVYATDDLTTNKFQISSGVSINLGFVSTLSGNAIPANNPLGSGASSAGKDTSIPSSLSAYAASTSDVQGTWYVFGLTAQSDEQGWFYGTQTFGSDGVLTAGSSSDSTGATHTDSPGDKTLAVDPSGVVFSVDSGISQQNRFNGIQDKAKEIIPGTANFTTTDGNSPGAIVGSALLAFVKQSDFAVSDLEGLWTAFALVPGSSQSTSGWMHGDLTIGTDGLATFPLNAYSSAVAIFPIADETFGLLPSGGHIWLTKTESAAPSSFRGALNPGGDIIVGVSELSNYGGLTGHALRVAVRKVMYSYWTLADLAGTWRTYTLGLGFGGGPTSRYGWNRSIITIDSSGNMTAGPGILSDGTAPVDAPGTALGVASINNAGVVTFSTNTTFYGAISADKTIMVGTMTSDSGGYSLTIWVR